MPKTRRSIAVALLLCTPAALAQSAQSASSTETVTIPAGTVLNVLNTTRIIPKTAKLGDPVPFVTAEPLRIDNRLVLPRRTALAGHVTGLKPDFQVTLDPLVVGDTTIRFADRPLVRKAVKANHSNEGLPPELRYNSHLTAGQTTEIALVGIIVVPIALGIVAVLTPFIVYEVIHHHGEIGYGTRSSVTTAEAATVTVKALPSTESYTGLPVLYILDRWHTRDNTLFCGTEPVSSKADRQDLTVRVPAGSYVFHTATKSEQPVTIDAQQDGRYLVYRDRAGLHGVDLKTRPDLLERVAPPATADYYLDYTTVAPSQLTTLQADRDRGGCGIERLLKTREPRTLLKP